MTPEPTNRVATNPELVLPGFIPCETCGGSGKVSGFPGVPYEQGPEFGGPCPSCSGLGVVPDPETVEAVYPVIERTSANAADWHEVARAALLAYARKARGET